MRNKTVFVWLSKLKFIVIWKAAVYVAQVKGFCYLASSMLMNGTCTRLNSQIFLKDGFIVILGVYHHTDICPSVIFPVSLVIISYLML